MAEKASAYPGRFYLFAHLPLGDGQAAAKELERCVKELGFVGAMISGFGVGWHYDVGMQVIRLMLAGDYRPEKDFQR